MEINFTGKRALVTGAGRGIGRQIVKHLVKCGAQVVALSRTLSHLETLQQEFATTGKLEVLCVDLNDLDGSRKAIEELEPFDLLVNNAAITSEESFDEINLESYEKLVNVNVKSVINVSQAVVKGMKAKGQGGAIVNVSSLLALRGLAYFSAYSSTKAAVDKLSQIMAIELGPHKIRVNSVNPQAVKTEMIQSLIDRNPNFMEERAALVPLKRICSVEDVSNVVMFLLSDLASMVTGVALPVDGGRLAGEAPKN